MRPVLHAIPTGCKARLSFLMLLAVGFCVPVAWGQSGSFEEASAAYKNADFDTAIELFSQLAQNTAVDKQERKQSLQYLGRAYVAKRMQQEAQGAMAELIELEPPIVELDPEQEPPMLMNAYYEARKEYTGGYAVEGRSDGIKTIAIIDFTNASIGDDFDKYAPLQRGFASMMINKLRGATDLKVIERERMQWLLEEHKLQRDPSLMDQQTAVRAGKLLGAGAVLIGSYSVAGKQMWMSARLVDVETGEILLAEQIIGKPADFFDLTEGLGRQITQAINVSMADAKAGRDTQSLDAMLSYSQGLAALEGQDYSGAYSKFKEALDFDPQYRQAQHRLDSLAPMLAVR